MTLELQSALRHAPVSFIVMDLAYVLFIKRNGLENRLAERKKRQQLFMPSDILTSALHLNFFNITMNVYVCNKIG